MYFLGETVSVFVSLQQWYDGLASSMCRSDGHFFFQCRSSLKNVFAVPSSAPTSETPLPCRSVPSSLTPARPKTCSALWPCPQRSRVGDVRPESHRLNSFYINRFKLTVTPRALRTGQKSMIRIKKIIGDWKYCINFMLSVGCFFLLLLFLPVPYLVFRKSLYTV